MDISIIIINFNTAQLTLDCIQSIKEKTNIQLSYEIIIIDNNSSIDDYQFLKNHLSENITLIRSAFNCGFSSGNMLGVHHATGKYLAFINSDVLLIDDCLNNLKDYMDHNTNVGVCGPKQVDQDLQWKKSFDHFHGIRKKLFGKSFLEFFFPKTKPKRKGNYNSPITVDFVQGSFMFFRSEYFAQTGGFDTNIFLYYEEMDICKRLKDNGYQSVHIPTSSFIHYEGASTKLGYFKKLELTISYLYVLRKNFGYPRYLFIKWFLIFQTFFKAIFNWGHWKLFFTLLTLGAPLSHSLRKKQVINFNDDES